MPWFSRGGGPSKEDREAARARVEAAQQRVDAWGAALDAGDLPKFVKERLTEARAGTAPWVSTMTPAELLLARSHGMRPLATVTGTCWFKFGYSWTEGHAEGWRTALRRLKMEALQCGANAVVDVSMRTTHGGDGDSMDYTLIGTAIKLKDLPASRDPIVATTPALEFVRLLEAGIVPTGIAIGAYYNFLTDYTNQFGGNYTWWNQPLDQLGSFWENARRHAHRELRADTARQGNGVLAHTHFGQILKIERENQPAQYLGRHIVIGTVVQVESSKTVPHEIETVVDMRDELSPLVRERPSGRTLFRSNDREEAI